MKKIEVTTREQLDELYNDDALTLEGFCTDEENLQRLFDWVRQQAGLKTERVYIISGKWMSDAYGLTGQNRYRDDLHIVCIKLADVERISTLAIARFHIEGRWFSDVVDNKRRREPDYVAEDEEGEEE